jgi:hypothetical protein
MISSPGGSIPETAELPEQVYRTFQGLIDDVRIYNRPLTDEEIACLAYRNCVPRLVGDFKEGDCAKIDLLDYAAYADEYITTYEIDNLAAIADNWLETDLIFPNY